MHPALPRETTLVDGGAPGELRKRKRETALLRQNFRAVRGDEESIFDPYAKFSR